MQKANQMRLTALDLESHIDDEIFRSLGIVYRNVTGASLNGLRFIRYADVDKWAVDYLLNRGCCDFVKTSTYPVVQAKYFIQECQYGLSDKASKDSSGVPILRINNIKRSRVDISDMKYVPPNLKSIGKYFLQCGDILLNRTNSKELVGKTAMFSLQGNYVFASYLIRIVLNQEVADARYINYIFASRIIRSQIDMISRQVLGQANINVEELKSLQFPLPPIVEQKKIATAIDNIYSQVDGINQGAETLETSAKREFNREVFE